MIGAALFALLFTLSLFAAACGGAPAAGAARAQAVAAPGPGEFPDEPQAVRRYHSARLKLSVPLPDGRAWRIDDHSRPALVAEHAPTRSTLTVAIFTEDELVSRKVCQTRAEERGLLALHDPRVIEDSVTVVPDAFDSRVWVALETPGAGAGALVGHAILVGGFIRKCLLVHYATSVSSDHEEGLLTSRLAVARLRILGGVQMEPFDQPPPVPLPGAIVPRSAGTARPGPAPR